MDWFEKERHKHRQVRKAMVEIGGLNHIGETHSTKVTRIIITIIGLN